jgi:hypothetical protein
MVDSWLLTNGICRKAPDFGTGLGTGRIKPKTGRAGYGWMPFSDEERANPLCHWNQFFSLLIGYSINKKACLRGMPLVPQNFRLAALPCLRRLVICLTTALSFVLTVTGQFWDWTTNTVFLNLFVAVRFFWKGEGNLWSGSGGIR